MLGAMIQQVTKRVTAYYQYETSRPTAISRRFSHSIDFPAITICNFNRFFYPQSDEELQAMMMLNRISPESFEFNQTESLTTHLAGMEFFLKYPNMTVGQFVEIKGYPLLDEESLLQCRFKTNKCSAADFKSVPTKTSGKCHTFNFNLTKELYQQIGGIGHGLSLMLNVLQWDYTEDPMRGRIEAGIKVQIHDKNEPPDPDRFGLAVPVGRKAYMSISRKDTTVMYKPWGQCDPQNEKKLLYFSNYTLHGCMQGGQLGLWIGMSFVTTIEILQYILFRLCSFCSGTLEITREDEESDKITKGVK